MKQCSKCLIEKEASFFSPDRRTSIGLQSKCKSCFAEMVKQKRLENPEKHREAVKQSVLKNYSKVLTRNNEYRKNNPDKVKEWKRNDRTNNKIRILADNAKRRSLFPSVVNSDVLSVYALRDFYTSMSLGDCFHVDHIQPLSKGGLHIVANLQVIPAIDNLRKGNKHATK